MSSRRYVSVPVTTLWTNPTAPRDVDASAVAPRPDVVAWFADLDAAQARLGLSGANAEAVIAPAHLRRLAGAARESPLLARTGLPG